MENSTSDKSLFDLSFDENVKQSLKGGGHLGWNSCYCLINWFCSRPGKLFC